jgi:OOP family OmpA-OmpF porin
VRKPYACLIAAVLLSAPEARADEGIFDDRFYAAPMGTFALVRDSRGTGGGVGGTLAAGFGFFPHLGMEVLGSNLHYNAHTLPASGIDAAAALDNVTSYGYGLNLYLSHTNRGLFAHFDGMGNKTLAYDGGLGYDLPLTHHGLGLRAEALYHWENGQQAAPLFNLGLFIPFGKVSQPATEPPLPPPAVVPPEEVAPLVPSPAS